MIRWTNRWLRVTCMAPKLSYSYMDDWLYILPFVFHVMSRSKDCFSLKELRPTFFIRVSIKLKDCEHFVLFHCVKSQWAHGFLMSARICKHKKLLIWSYVFFHLYLHAITFYYLHNSFGWIIDVEPFVLHYSL